MNKKYLIGGGVVGVAVVVLAVWFFFFKDDAPDAVDVGDANEQLDADLAEDGGDAGPAVADGIDGVWVVDDEIGSFDFDTASGSFAGFRVAEELTIGSVTAVGRSGGVTGSVTIDGGQLTGADVTVDMNSIVSNDPRRESAIRRAIGAAEFPTATFTFDGGVDVSGLEAGGAAHTFEVEGDLTVAGVTNPVTFSIDANVRDDGFGVIVGSTEIVWEDFGVTPPSASIVVSIADEGTVEFQLIVAR
ncbi:MAG: hypothetical protein DHS20C19_22170 [Acidimicrobiales bacterium]|nr:MAG: hypothetical protein DHS20C19_22170 [Acidimicrobiales bacterium]